MVGTKGPGFLQFLVVGELVPTHALNFKLTSTL
jgi:hypothetical protein